MGEAFRKRLKQEKVPDPLQEALINVLVAAGHIRERLEHFCEQYGITAAQYNVLRILRGVHPDGHPRGEIAARMVERSPDVTRLIDRLEGQGLVARDRSRNDRRLSITKITSKGLRLLEGMHPETELQRYFSNRLSTRDRREISRICEALYSEENN
jgi:DNA-binding MarR family transcriptional regulator